jgi:hypothetical protein
MTTSDKATQNIKCRIETLLETAPHEVSQAEADRWKKASGR